MFNISFGNIGTFQIEKTFVMWSYMKLKKLYLLTFISFFIILSCGTGIIRKDGYPVSSGKSINVIYYKISYYNSGVSRGSIVGNNQIDPDNNHKKFSKYFIEKIKKDFSENNLKLVEAETGNNNVNIEMRISFTVGVDGVLKSIAGSRWIVKYKDSEAEIYNFQPISENANPTDAKIQLGAMRLSSMMSRNFFELYNSWSNN